MIKGTIVIIGTAPELQQNVGRLREKKYSVLGIEQWPQGDYIQAPMYCLTPAENPFQKEK